jgi:hypothetical protein
VSMPSGTWTLGALESTHPTQVLGRIDVKPRRRRPVIAIALGLFLGVGLAVGLIGWRLHSLGVELPFAHLWMPPAAMPPPPPGSKRATVAVKARIRIKTTPVGADVLEISSGVPRLLGITPLVVPWEVAPGDLPRQLLLKMAGHVPARATVDPPQTAAPNGQPVWLDVEATLRPQAR